MFGGSGGNQFDQPVSNQFATSLVNQFRKGEPTSFGKGGQPVSVLIDQDAGLGRVIQGALEASNVNVVTELVSMIETQRAYEVSSKSITSVDEMLRYISQNL